MALTGDPGAHYCHSITNPDASIWEIQIKHDKMVQLIFEVRRILLDRNFGVRR